MKKYIFSLLVFILIVLSVTPVSLGSPLDLIIPDNYYYFYLVPRDNYNFPRDNIYVGQPARVFVYLKNTGSSSVNANATVNLSIGSIYSKNITKEVSLAPATSEIFTFDLIFNDSKTYTIMAKSFVFYNGKYVETSEQSFSVTPKLITLKVISNAPSKVEVPELNVVTDVNTAISVPFVDFSVIVLNKTYVFNQTKYEIISQSKFVFKADYKKVVLNETISGASFDISKQIILNVDYNYFYNVTITTVNLENAFVKTKITLVFPNGSSIETFVPYNAWLPSGQYKVASAVYQNYNVIPYAGGYVFDISQPTVKQVVVQVDDQIIRVKDILGLPLQGANVTVTFFNGTTKLFVTNNAGEVFLSQIPMATLESGQVEYNIVGVDQKQDLSPNGKVITVTFTLSYNTLALVVALIIIILILLGWKGKLPFVQKKKQQ
jgi:hypothetical protein